MRFAVLAGILSLALAACGGGGDPAASPTFAELRAAYDALEDRIFPGSRTRLEESLSLIDADYEGTAVLAYYQDGEDFTEAGAARVSLSFGNVGLALGVVGLVTDIRLESARPVAGRLGIGANPLSGHDFDARVSGDLVIAGETVEVEGRIDGSFYTPSGASEEGGFAYGNISFSAGPGSHRFAGTFAVERVRPGS